MAAWCGSAPGLNHNAPVPLKTEFTFTSDLSGRWGASPSDLKMTPSWGLIVYMFRQLDESGYTGGNSTRIDRNGADKATAAVQPDRQLFWNRPHVLIGSRLNVSQTLLKSTASWAILKCFSQLAGSTFLQIKGSGNSFLLSTCSTPSGMLCPVWGLTA